MLPVRNFKTPTPPAESWAILPLAGTREASRASSTLPVPESIPAYSQAE